MKKFIFVVVFIFSSFVLTAEETENFMVYGEGFMVNVPLPDYWAVDMKFAQENGLNGFFFIEKFGIKNSPSAIMLTLAEKPTKDSKLSEYIAYDKDMLKHYYPKMIYKAYKTKKKGNKKYTYKIFEFYSEPQGGHQYIAYIDCGQKYMIKLYITLVSKDKSVKKYVSDFLDCVYGFKFVSSNVTVE